MKRIIGIDYGTKKCGIAVTDPLQIIVSGLDTVHESKLFDFISNYLEKEEVEKIVIGKPTHIDGTPTHLYSHIVGLIKKLNKQYPDLPIVLHDESYTSQRAREILVQSGTRKSKRRERGNLDKISAVLILQEYLGHI